MEKSSQLLKNHEENKFLYVGLINALLSKSVQTSVWHLFLTIDLASKGFNIFHWYRFSRAYTWPNRSGIGVIDRFDRFKQVFE